jgi:hypothetical protein
MSRNRIERAAPLLLLAALATIGVLALPGGSPLRIVAGLLLLPTLPWLAASRLPPLGKGGSEGQRISAAGALALASAILLGLLLVVGGDGLRTGSVAVGMLVVTAVLALLGDPEGRLLPRPELDNRRWGFGVALTLAAIAIAVLAFSVARNRALSQAQQETAYAAFIAADGPKLDVGLVNTSDRPTDFTVQELGDLRHRTSLIVPPKSTGRVKGFLERPPRLRPIERVVPRRVDPVRVRITASVDGRTVGQPLYLSTYAPGGGGAAVPDRSSLAQSHISRSSPRAKTPNARR